MDAVQKRPADIARATHHSSRFGRGSITILRRMMRMFRRDVTTGTTVLPSPAIPGAAIAHGQCDMILICDSSGAIIVQNPASAMHWGYKALELVALPIGGLVHHDDQSMFHDFWAQTTAQPSNNGTIELRVRDGFGRWRVAHLTGINLIGDPAVAGLVMTARDITERKALEQHVLLDPLTGLPNRALGYDRLEQALIRARRRKDTIGLLVLEFGPVESEIGETLLIEATGRLRGCVRAEDTVARLGGEQFMVVLEFLADPGDASSIATTITDQFRRPIRIGDRDIPRTVSIGLALSDGPDESADTLLRKANAAMQRSRSEHRSPVMFVAGLHADAPVRTGMEADLRHAIDEGRLRIHYQPVITLASGRIDAIEAQVYWKHSEHGLIPPATFIPIAEETGLIIPIGKWILDQSCLQLAQWHRQFPHDPPLTLCISLSPRQLQKPFLAADIIQALLEAGLAASCLRLQLAESAIMGDFKDCIRTLWELRELGIRIVIDHFGAGRASLPYLKRLPLDALKIDPAFLAGAGAERQASATIGTIIAGARSLGLKVMVDGIKTAAQAALLHANGCEFGQGDHFGKPLDVRQTTALLEAAAHRTRAA